VDSICLGGGAREVRYQARRLIALRSQRRGNGRPGLAGNAMSGLGAATTASGLLAVTIDDTAALEPGSLSVEPGWPGVTPRMFRGLQRMVLQARELNLWFSCGLTFEVRRDRRQDAKPGPVKMYPVPPARAWWPAVGPRLDRRVRPHSSRAAN
jgi:hypothetical protein